MSESRDELLARVLDHVAAHGLADTSLRTIADGVGTSHRMLNYHFGSRAGLVAAVAAAVEEQQRVAMGEAARHADGPTEVMRAVWAQVSDPATLPFVRVFFEVLALGLNGRPGTEHFMATLTDPWVASATDAAIDVGSPVDEAQLRLGVAVVRGLLVDLLASGDRAAADAAFERFVAMAEALATRT